MGCDIHCYAERKNELGEWGCLSGFGVFSWRDYRVFGFLAGVRNYSAVVPVAACRGLPQDVSREVAKFYVEQDEIYHCHNASWLNLIELTTFDYDALCEDRRVLRQISERVWHGGCTCAEGEGTFMTFRKFLGIAFFNELKKLQALQAERIIFWFDN